MPNDVVFRTKPSIVPTLVVWPLTGIVFACPLLAVGSYMSNSIGILAAMFDVFALLVLALAIIRLIVDLIDREFTTYTLTDTRVIREFGILTQRRSEMPIDRSRADVITPLAGRFFNDGTLRVQCSGLMPMRLSYLPDAQKWQEEIAKRNTQRIAVVRG